jgi:uncharacterized iron-regulated membrane protein
MNEATATTAVRESWLNYRTIWRWHFYAGLLSIPLVVWLATTGSIFLFKPQIERLLDRPFDRLSITGPRASAEAQAMAALAAVPGSHLHYYELPVTANSATRVIVGRGTEEIRVYVHPQTLAVLKTIDEDSRPMNVVSHLHGELMLGDRGSMLVELTASWAIVLVLTGVYLWWPRQAERLAGVLYVRVRQGRRLFWRDLHAVTGVWVSAFALFLLLTGLPWAKSWGGYLKRVRTLTGTSAAKQDWTTGRSSEIARRMAMTPNGMDNMAMEEDGHAGHAKMKMPAMPVTPGAYLPLDRMVATVAPLGLAYPVLISPPVRAGDVWTAKSDAQDRPLRTDLTLDPSSGAILSRVDFRQKKLIDRMVGVGVAAHEGQLFGVFNQMLGLFTAMGLILMCVSAVVLWWRRRAVGVLGAPLPTRQPRFSWGLAALVAAFGLYLPMLGLSLIVVLLSEHFVLRRIEGTRRWLGLQPVV